MIIETHRNGTPIILKGCYSPFSIYFNGANFIRRTLKLNFCPSSLSSVINVFMYVWTPQPQYAKKQAFYSNALGLFSVTTSIGFGEFTDKSVT